MVRLLKSIAICFLVCRVIVDETKAVPVDNGLCGLEGRKQIYGQNIFKEQHVNSELNDNLNSIKNGNLESLKLTHEGSDNDQEESPIESNLPEKTTSSSSAEPTTSADETTSEEPITSVEPTTSADETTSVEPTTSVDETTSVEPTTSEEPITSVEPTTSEEPITSVEPTTSADETTSVEPTTSADETTSDEETTSVEPTTSAISSEDSSESNNDTNPPIKVCSSSCRVTVKTTIKKKNSKGNKIYTVIRSWNKNCNTDECPNISEDPTLTSDGSDASNNESTTDESIVETSGESVDKKTKAVSRSGEPIVDEDTDKVTVTVIETVTVTADATETGVETVTTDSENPVPTFDVDENERKVKSSESEIVIDESNNISELYRCCKGIFVPSQEIGQWVPTPLFRIISPIRDENLWYTNTTQSVSWDGSGYTNFDAKGEIEFINIIGFNHQYLYHLGMFSPKSDGVMWTISNEMDTGYYRVLAYGISKLSTDKTGETRKLIYTLSCPIVIYNQGKSGVEGPMSPNYQEAMEVVKSMYSSEELSIVETPNIEFLQDLIDAAEANRTKSF